MEPEKIHLLKGSWDRVQGHGPSDLFNTITPVLLLDAREDMISGSLLPT